MKTYRVLTVTNRVVCTVRSPNRADAERRARLRLGTAAHPHPGWLTVQKVKEAA